MTHLGDLGDLVRAKSWSTNMSFATTMAPVPGISGTEEIHEASPAMADGARQFVMF